jgi:flagellar motor switch protein FliG
LAVLTGREKVNIFLAILGPEISAKILRYLPEEMAVLIASGVGKIVPSKEAIGLVMKDFGRLFLTAAGGPPLTLKETAEATKQLPFEGLAKNCSPKSLFNFLSGERIQTAAYILSRFGDLPTAGVLSLFPPEVKSKVELAMSKMKKTAFSDKFVAPVQNILRDKLLEVYGSDQKRVS